MPGRLYDALLAVPGIATYAVYFVAPFAIFALYSVYTGDLFSAGPPLTLSPYDAVLRDHATWTYIINSAKVALPVTALTLTIGLPVTYWLRYNAGRWQLPVLFAITATVFAGYLVRIYAWRGMLGEHGLVNEGLLGLGLIHRPLGFLLFNRTAVVLAQTQMLLPVAILQLLAAFRPLDGGYIEASRDLGCGHVRLWTRVILPCIAAPLALTGLLVFAISAADWVTPQMLGNGRATMLGQAIESLFTSSGDYPTGAALSMVGLGAFLVLYALVLLGVRLRGLGGLRWRDSVASPPWRNRIGAVITGLTLVFLAAPLVLVVLFSFNSGTTLTFPFDGFSLRWYHEFFHDPIATSALLLSLRVAAIVASLTLVIGLLTAVSLGRLPRAVSRPIVAAMLLPIAVPPLFIGLALLTFFLEVGTPLSTTTIVIAHLSQTVPLFVLIARLALERLDPALDDCAADMGAGGWATFRLVTLPQIWPALAAGTALAFAMSFDEFAVTVFNSGNRSTLPMYIYGRFYKTIDPTVNAVSTLLMATTVLLFVVAASIAYLSLRRRARAADGRLTAALPRRRSRLRPG